MGHRGKFGAALWTIVQGLVLYSLWSMIMGCGP
jgi:hypothetical protein